METKNGKGNRPFNSMRINVGHFRFTSHWWSVENWVFLIPSYGQMQSKKEDIYKIIIKIIALRFNTHSYISFPIILSSKMDLQFPSFNLIFRMHFFPSLLLLYYYCPPPGRDGSLLKAVDIRGANLFALQEAKFYYNDLHSF